MIDANKHPFEAEIDHDVEAFRDLGSRLRHRPTGRASGPEAETRLGEWRLPTRLLNLRQRRLDQPVNDTRDAELTAVATRLETVMPELIYVAARVLESGRRLALEFSSQCPAFPSCEVVYANLRPASGAVIAASAMAPSFK